MLKTKKNLELSSASNKLSQDINFLLEKLTLMQEQAPSNIQVQENYQSMLDYRLDVLAEVLTLCQKSDELEVVPFKLRFP